MNKPPLLPPHPDSLDESSDNTTTIRMEAPSEFRESSNPWPGVGTVFKGRFRFTRPLKSGANGQVWEAVNLDLGVRVAIKLPGLHKMKPSDLERFRREARALCMIHHEHVLRFFEFSTEPTPYLVMEFLRGHDLAERMNQRGIIPLSEAKAICSQVCAGLQAIHSAGILHRDIKPGNIFYVEETGKIKIVDFGLMKLLRNPSDTAIECGWANSGELTETGAILGTPIYISPEQWTDQNIGPQSDLWSVAIVLYRLLTGHIPFQARTHYALMRKVIREPAPPPSSKRGDLPPEVDQFFERALAKNPSKRYATAEEFNRSFLSIQDGPARPSGADPLRPEPPAMRGIPAFRSLSSITTLRLHRYPKPILLGGFFFGIAVGIATLLAILYSLVPKSPSPPAPPSGIPALVGPKPLSEPIQRTLT